MRNLLVFVLAVACSFTFAVGSSSIDAPRAEAALPPASGATSPAPPNGNFTQPAVVVSAPTNYGFENGLTGWSISGPATVQPGGASGNYILLSSASAVSQAFTVQPSATTFSYYVNTSIPGGAYSKLWVAPGPTYTAWAQLDAVLGATNGWQLRTVSFADYVNQSVEIQYIGVLGAAAFDEGALFDQIPGWTESASALSIPSVAMPATNPNSGTFLNCHGAAAGPTVTSVAQLWGNPGTMLSDEFTVSTTGEPLYFRAAGSGAGPVYQIGIFTEVDNFSAVTVLTSGTLPYGDSFFTACDVSQWAGKRAKIRLQAVSPGSIFFAAGGVTFGAKSDSQSSVDPVQFATGIDTHEHTDLSIPGKGIALSFTRQYVSTGTPKQGRLGWGWTDNFDTQLTEFSGGSVLVQRPDGGTSYYSNNGGVLSPPPGDFSTLVKNGDGTYTLTAQDRVQMRYGTNGRLTSMADRNGNTTSLAYNGYGQLASVTDPGGRALTFTYEPGASAINTPAPQLAFTNADFEAGTYVGWTPTGTSFGTAPTTQATATWASGIQGTYFASSYVAGSSQSDGFTGTLVSQAFTAGKQVVFLLEGGTDVSTLHVSLVLPDATEVLLTANATNSNTLLPITFDTTPYEGQSVRLKLVDNSTATTWAHLSIDNVQVLTSPTGTYAPSLGVPTSPFYNSDVEQNSWANWFLTGTAFGRRPATDQLGGRQGAYYISSRVVNDAATGTITSAPFTAGTSMSFMLAGGNFPSAVYAALVLGDGTEVLKTVPTSANDLLPVTLNTAGYAGQTVRFRLVDSESATNGFIRADALTVTYNARLKTVSDGLGRTVTYGYDDATNDLTSVTNVGGGTSAFTYSGHRLVTIKDSLNRIQVTNTYDTANRVAEQADALNGTTCFYYGSGVTHTSVNCPGTTPVPQAGETVMVDPRGNRWRYQHDSAFRTTGVEDPLGNATVYTYEATGALCSPSNRGNLCSVNDPLGHSTSFTYESQGNVLTRKDALNNTWTYTYNAFNDVLTATDPLARVTTYTYNASGTLTSVKNALNQTTTYTPNADGTLASVTDPLGHATSFTYDAYGNVTVAADALGHTQSSAYDLGGRMLSTSDGLNHTTTYTYDNQNNVLTSTNPLSQATTYTYDAKGQKVSVTDANNRTTTFGYDSAGNLISVTDPLAQAVTYGYDANGNRTTMTNTRGKVTNYTYDAGNRLITETDPLIRTTTYGYDAASRQTSRLDAKGQTTVYSYDAGDRLITITYPIGTPNVTFTYDALGNRLSMTDGTGATAYAYDALYRPSSVTDGATNTVAYGYDAGGRRTSITYPGATGTVTYGYDNANRLTSVTDWLAKTTTYGYDSANRLASTALPNGLTTTRTYDNADRLLTLANLNGAATVSSYTYVLDAVGNRTQMTDTTGVTSYQYDALYRLTRATYPGWQLDTYTYDAMGNRLSRNAVTYAYDDADQMTGVTTADTDGDGCVDTDEAPGASGQAPGATGAYDPQNGQDFYDVPVPVITQANPGGTKSRAVNVNDQQAVLYYVGTAATNPNPNVNGVRYNDDWNNNGIPDGREYDRSASPAPNPPYDAGAPDGGVNINDVILLGNQIGRACSQNAGTIVSTYDNNGNQITRGTATFGYDAENRLVSSTGPSTTYAYNGDGLRASRTISTTTTFVWDQNSGLPQILKDSAGNSYVYGLDLISRTASAGSQEYYVTDGLGSTTGITDGTGTQTDTYQYDVFGANRSRAGTSTSEFKFTGEQTDPSGLQYLRARYYDSATGRFIGKDPLPFLQRYAYVGGNPVNLTDPTGEFPCPGCGKIKDAARATADTWNDFATAKWDCGAVCSGIDQGLKTVGNAELSVIENPYVQQCATWGASGAVFGGWGAVGGCAAGLASQYAADRGWSNPGVNCVIWGGGGLIASKGTSFKAIGTAGGCIAGALGSLVGTDLGRQCTAWGLPAAIYNGASGPQRAAAGLAGCLAGEISARLSNTGQGNSPKE